MDARTAQLVAALRRRRVAGAADLAADLGVSQPTLSRLLRAMQGDVVSFGRARRTRYAPIRRVRGLLAEPPVYRVTADGRPQPHLLHPSPRPSPARGEGELLASASA
jgi:hypothetical protein